MHIVIKVDFFAGGFNPYMFIYCHLLKLYLNITIYIQNLSPNILIGIYDIMCKSVLKCTSTYNSILIDRANINYFTCPHKIKYCFFVSYLNYICNYCSTVITTIVMFFECMCAQSIYLARSVARLDGFYMRGIESS